MLLDGGADCNKGLHSDILIDKYYTDIVSCINDSSRNCIPGRKFNGDISEYVIPGWNELVADKYSASRKAFWDLVAAGKPHHCMLNEIMRRTRSQFKLALQCCKQHEMTLRADALVNSLSNKEYRKFRKSVNRSNNNKAVKYASTIAAVSYTHLTLPTKRIV